MDEQTKQNIWKQTQVVVFVDDPKSVNGYIANATRNVEALLAALEAAEAWSAAWKRKAKMLRDWYFYAEKHIFRAQELSQRVKELEATNARMRAALDVLADRKNWIGVADKTGALSLVDWVGDDGWPWEFAAQALEAQP